MIHMITYDSYDYIIYIYVYIFFVHYRHLRAFGKAIECFHSGPTGALGGP